jgi:hypothetical protein
MTVSRAIVKVINALVAVHTSRRATYILSPKLTVCAARRHKHDGRATRAEFVLTIGAPNYQSRQLIKLAKRAGEPFPIKKLQFQPSL